LRLSWEQLNADADAHRRLRAVTMLQHMVAAQGDEISWDRQKQSLAKILNEQPR
jgi:hypothetical protein